MKKTLLFLALCGLIGTANAQFEVETPEGDPIEDGSIYTFGTAEYPDALLNFFVRNTGSAAIDTNISVEAFSNTDGVEMELCYLETPKPQNPRYIEIIISYYINNKNVQN